MQARRMLGWMIVCMAALAFGTGCGTPPPEIQELTLSKTTVAPGEELGITLKVNNFEIVEGEGHSHDHDHGDAPATTTATQGHYHIYYDNKSDVVAMATKSTWSITIPTTMAEGEHKLRVELVGTDHSVFNPTITKEVTFTVKK